MMNSKLLLAIALLVGLAVPGAYGLFGWHLSDYDYDYDGYYYDRPWHHHRYYRDHYYENKRARAACRDSFDNAPDRVSCYRACRRFRGAELDGCVADQAAPVDTKD